MLLFVIDDVVVDVDLWEIFGNLTELYASYGWENCMIINFINLFKKNESKKKGLIFCIIIYLAYMSMYVYCYVFILYYFIVISKGIRVKINKKKHKKRIYNFNNNQSN